MPFAGRYGQGQNVCELVERGEELEGTVPLWGDGAFRSGERGAAKWVTSGSDYGLESRHAEGVDGRVEVVEEK